MKQVQINESTKKLNETTKNKMKLLKLNETAKTKWNHYNKMKLLKLNETTKTKWNQGEENIKCGISLDMNVLNHWAIETKNIIWLTKHQKTPNPSQKRRGHSSSVVDGLVDPLLYQFLRAIGAFKVTH